MKRLLPVLLALSGCTVIDTAVVPSQRGNPNEVFVTAGDIMEPHDVIGLVQASRHGVLLFGFLDPIGTDLESAFVDTLIPYIKELGGDGAVRARFHMTQYTPATKVFGAIFFFLPLPSQVTITAQVVKLRKGEHRAVPASPTSQPGL
jgi:hypothetical protein